LQVLAEIALQKKVLDDRDIMVFEKVFKLPPVPKETKLKVAKVLAEHFIPRQRSDETAIIMYRFLWQTEPAALSPLGIQLLAHDIAKSGEVGKYAPLLKKALESRYDKPLANALATAYLTEGRLDAEALAHYLRVLREDPTNEAILAFVTPKILESQDPDPDYYPIILGALERNSAMVLSRLVGEQGKRILLKMGKHLIERRRYRQAQLALESAKKNFPDDVGFDYLLAVALAAQGQADVAYRVLQHLVKQRPEPLLIYRLGHVALLAGKTSEAETIFGELAKQYPNHPLLTARRGQLAEVKGSGKEALELYQTLAGSQTPYAPFGALKLVQLGSKTNGKVGEDARIAALTEDRIFGPQAQALLAYNAFLAGKEDFDRNDYRGAARNWEAALGFLTANANTEEISRALAEALFRLGIEAFSRDQYTQAEAHFKKASEILSTHGPAMLFEAAACHASGKLIKAKSGYEQVLDRAPELHDEVGVMYGKLELHKKHFDLANDLFEGALQGTYRAHALLGRALSFYLNAEEDHLPASLKGGALQEIYTAGLLEPAFLGVLFSQVGQHKEGAAILEKVVQKDLAENNFPFEALFILGFLYTQAEQRKIAFHHWQRLLDLSAVDIKRMGDERGIPREKLVELYYGLLYRYLHDSQIEEAMAVLQKLEGLDPDGADLNTARSYVALHRGYLASKEKAYHHAINHWKEALKFAPNLAAYQNLGLVEMIKTHPDLALRYWKTFFDILERKVKTAPDENDVIQLNETRRIVNLLNTFTEEDEFKAALKKEIFIDDIEQVNQHYWTLNLSKGAGLKDADKAYFRLIRTYNPERYPKEFMTIEAAYQFFQDANRLRKAEILVFNGFNIHKALRSSRLPFKWGLPELPSINRQIDSFVNPANIGKLIRPMGYAAKLDLSEVAESLKPGELQLVDYLAEW
ncbi:MAG: tetratricopeptide repeat protein, partial [bacterium]